MRIPLQEKIIFTKNLALSLKSGISLVRSLKFLADQTESRKFKRILEELIEDTNKGLYLSVSMERFKDVFGELFINVIRVGESSGNLPENLLYLSKEIKKSYDMRKKVKSAAMYPMVIFGATILVATGMIVFVFPKMLPFFQSLKVELPWTTRLLIAISNFFSHYGLIVAVVFGLCIFAFPFVMKIKPIRFLWHSVVLKLPIVGRMVVFYNIASFSRTLSLLLKSGLNIIESLRITSQAMTNLVYARELEDASRELEKGTFLSHYLALYRKQFPVLATNMIEVGENTGNLTENLAYVSEYYESEVDDFVKNIASVLEPVLLLFMGVIVGFIALSFITPLYQITRNIK